MAAKYKISIRKVLQALLTLVVSLCCVIAMISASNIESSKPLSNVEVHIISGKKYHFIEETQILDEAIRNRNVDVTNTPVGKVDIKAMEQVLEADPWVAHAQLYVDNNRVLQMIVTQRIPVARLFEQDGSSCYMDNTLHTMPLAPNFNFYTSVVTNVPVLGNDSISLAVKKNIVTMIHAIQADTFWNAQISQVIFDSGYTFELMPVLGDQLIVFGDTSRTNEKFNNLYAFYKKILNRIGWDKYEKLDLRFKGQVIASPSLPYKGPVDKANATMNWLDAFVSTEVKKDSLAALAEGRSPDLAAEKQDPKKDPKKDAKKDAKPEPKDKPKLVAVAKEKHVESAKDKEKKAHDSKEKDKKDNKDGHAAKDKKQDAGKDKNKAKDKPKEKAVLKLSDLGKEKK